MIDGEERQGFNMVVIFPQNMIHLQIILMKILLPVDGKSVEEWENHLGIIRMKILMIIILQLN